ncbi:MAG: 2-C-methyl-D-erythritol 2,4-cyclodiphosphate synthase [Planctomycetia bacterium]|nr:2-C-methyl-D-erythritol 2,4-cyclodiphosphate synthase [Planctomycetia bacterium]
MIDLRTGIGHDTHRLVEGRSLRLGGIDIPFDRGLDGHSDADVLIHAIVDALLGAAGLGDIGQIFPDTDPKNKNRDSAEFLLEAVRLLNDRGFRILNLDTILFAEKPKLGDHRPKIRQRLADLLQLDPDRINIKAKTGEKIGIIGREEAISAEAIVLIEKNLKGTGTTS